MAVNVVFLGLSAVQEAMFVANPMHHVVEILVATWAAHAVLGTLAALKELSVAKEVVAVTMTKHAVAPSVAWKVLSAVKEATFAVRTTQHVAAMFVVLTGRNVVVTGVALRVSTAEILQERAILLLCLQ